MKKDWKDTLLMPNTSFESRGKLSQKDPKFISFWEERKVIEKNSKYQNKYILHDGPPYANGNIHVGHALNKILKDFIIRDKMLNGFAVDWRPGWDTHGLPIEWELQKKGIKLNEIGLENYLKKCRNFALSQVEKQEKQFKSLAISADFKKKYLTLDYNLEAAEIKIFHKMLNDNLAYQSLKPIYWSWSSQTSLAEAEIEYKDLESYSIYVKFKIKDSDLNILIWTTTPWTLPGNRGLAFGEDIDYSIVEHKNEKIIIATELINSLESKINSELKVIDKFEVSEFINKLAINPVTKNESKIIYGHHVTTEAGTGIVHIAGGHGHDDYLISQKNNLELVVVMNEEGKTINSGKYDGEFYLVTEENIVNDLEKNNSLLFYDKFTHSHPVDWRTKQPVIYRATKQWFVSINKIKNGILKEIPNVEWNPKWGGERLSKMTNEREDWCISRQRVWGVPIPIIYDENNKPIIDKELQLNIEKIFKEKGSYGYMKEEIENLLPEHIKYNNKMRKETDILDVWFDSGSVHQAQTPGIQSDVYVEGTDQYRGWFNSSLITSYIMNGKAPYKKIITHGFVTDGDGHKMSKSIGNVIDPLKITKESGSDIIRLWVASSNYTDNIKISSEIIDQIKSDYTNIRNKLRFMIGNLKYYDNSKPKLSTYSNAIIKSVSNLYENIKVFYKENNYSKIIKTMINEINSGSIQHFLDYLKDILYVYPENHIERREIEFVLDYILKVIMYSLATIIPVTIDEVFTTLNNMEKSIFETQFKNEIEPSNKEWEYTKNIINCFNKEWEEFRKNNSEITKTSQIDLVITINNSLYSPEELMKILSVSFVEIKDGNDLKIEIAKTKNKFKCSRCWKYFNKVNDDEICELCEEAIKN